jgi:hypothetical protein
MHTWQPKENNKVPVTDLSNMEKGEIPEKNSK